ncbi:thioredoxin-like protein [Podospora appendiculata]|uniref:Glutathione S-transferase kappa n=1 Tax=Podospora appendiculata TaxID=314037 RepID=A0AAE1CF57_9PEZI|nr:thioredoxin-like protein [Podospora appendiculata]
MGGRIDVYLDIVSLYSYIAYLDLLKNRALLSAHSVEVEFHPVFLGAINAGSGNKPPWTLPAKALYGAHDARRSVARHPGLTIQTPDDLMAVAMTVLPLRALHHIKRTRPSQTYEATLHALMRTFWSGAPTADLSQPTNLGAALSPLFAPAEVDEILAAAGSPEMKEALKAATREALDRGAFGCPWLWVTDSRGHGEPFFGSDRFHFIYKFLGLPYQDVTLLPPAATEGVSESGESKSKL